MKRSILGAMLLFLCGCGDDGNAPPLPETATDDDRRWCLWLGYEYTEPSDPTDPTDQGNLKDHFPHAYCANTTTQSGTCSDECDFKLPLRTCSQETTGACVYNADNRACVIGYKMNVASAYAKTTCKTLQDAKKAAEIAALLDVSSLGEACVALATECPEIFDFVRTPYKIQ